MIAAYLAWAAGERTNAGISSGSVLLVRPGFVTGRMTASLPRAPLAATPEAVGRATAAALRRGGATVWVPPSLAGLSLALRLIPRPLWRRISR
jgi:decaprenylphospho-beta-D-erythro-pentofuranosid-2-ulose 2-reductase